MSDQIGYTKINNDILERIAILPFTATQIKIIVVVCRYTFGFGRDEHGISESFLAKATGISKRHISSELKKLVALNVVEVIKESTWTKPKIISLNKNVSEWDSGSTVLLVNPSSTVEVQFCSEVNHSSTGSGSTVLLGDELQFHQETKNIKENNKENFKENTNVVFETLWKLYPKKEGKGQVSKTQKEKLAKIGIEELTRTIERYKKAKEGVDRKYIQNGSTFFNSGYVDYLDSNYQEKEDHNGEHSISGGNTQPKRKPWELVSEADKAFFDQGF
ncbi:MAG: replication protein [Desulfitobacterium hafniense]|uniref:replication protein n=1 Tax=Desulfosporosinus sp. TaxID=157907 RepID=UPI00230D4D5C|nr:replication protein [Desulfosporosinus sp.]MDA8227825.1 replication protein [Desulfitobacterium hafniense]